MFIDQFKANKLIIVLFDLQVSNQVLKLFVQVTRLGCHHPSAYHQHVAAVKARVHRLVAPVSAHVHQHAVVTVTRAHQRAAVKVTLVLSRQLSIQVCYRLSTKILFSF